MSVDNRLVTIPLRVLEDYHDMKVNEVREYEHAYSGYYNDEGTRWWYAHQDLLTELKEIEELLELAGENK